MIKNLKNRLNKLCNGEEIYHKKKQKWDKKEKFDKIEKILNVAEDADGDICFLVKWENHGPSENSWLAYEEIGHYPITREYIKEIIANDNNKIHECFCKYCGERKGIESNSIQCIECNFWVHGECAGYKKGDIRKMEKSEFKCKYCVKEEEEEKKKLALIGI
ncbi:unnamed protein product [Meloidogyne enterolobii]|uniref:Uncharacterized protein n=1 Tax=Meloidogyne enterolobii TaxID=390850 RepID=A0ACB0YBJ1_MELEN